MKYSKLGVWAVGMLIAGSAMAAPQETTDELKPVVFPELNEAWASKKFADPEAGLYPSWDEMHNIRKGIGKAELRRMFGSPHFSEGLFDVREWDYIFHFRLKDKSVATCQFKVQFDENYKGQDFFWKPASCATLFEKQVKSSPDMAPRTEPRRYVLSNEVLFASGSAALSAAGKNAVSDWAQHISKEFDSVDRMTVVGHADRMGSDAFNLRLSEKRANAVTELALTGLNTYNLNPNYVVSKGEGERQPVTSAVECQGKKGKLLSACLKPDRRVEIEINGVLR